MKTNATIAPLGTLFNLPMTAVFSVVNHPDRTVAHALDFDLVAVAPTEEEAIAKIRLAVKHHIEFGLRNSFGLDILQLAPEQYWATLSLDATLSIGEPIEVCQQRIRTATKKSTDTKTTSENEHNRSLAAA